MVAYGPWLINLLGSAVVRSKSSCAKRLLLKPNTKLAEYLSFFLFPIIVSMIISMKGSGIED